MDDHSRNIMDYLMLKGAIQPAGMSETGEPLYNFTPELKNVMPSLYNEHLNYVNAELMRLWEKGFISMNLLDSNPTVRLTDKAFDEFEIATLSEEDQFSMREIKRILMQ